MNPNKVQRWSDVLPEFKVVGPDAFGIRLDVPEGFDSVEANARAKAQAYAVESGVVTLSEDAGLRIHALNGAPGAAVRRWGGEVEANLSDAGLLDHLVSALRGLDDTDAIFDVGVAVAAVDGSIWSDSVASPGYFDLSLLGAPLPEGNPLSALFISRETERPWADMTHLEDRPRFSQELVGRVRAAVERAQGRQRGIER